jgi:hypothetical protein
VKTGKTVKRIIVCILAFWALWAVGSVAYQLFTGGQELCPTLAPYIYGAGALELLASGAIAIAKWVTPTENNGDATLDQEPGYADSTPAQDNPTQSQSDPTVAALEKALNEIKALKRRVTLVEGKSK